VPVGTTPGDGALSRCLYSTARKWLLRLPWFPSFIDATPARHRQAERYGRAGHMAVFCNAAPGCR
jgi:hypothetical protein